MALRTALSRRRRKIPPINNPTAGLRLTQDLSNTKTTQTLGCYIWPRSCKTTQTLGCYIWPRGWVTQKLPKHWKNNPKKITQKAQPHIWVKKITQDFLECREHKKLRHITDSPIKSVLLQFY